MPEIIQLGPLMVKGSWLVIGIGLWLGLTVIKGQLKHTPYFQQKIQEAITTSLMIVVILWKLGPVIFNPALIWTEPNSILFVSGRIEHFWLGTIIAFVYLLWKMRKIGVPYLFLLDLLPLGFLVVFILYNFLIWGYGNQTALPWGISIQKPEYKYHPINVYQLFATIPLLFIMWKKKHPLGEGKNISLFLIFFGLGQMIISFFSPQNAVFLGLSLGQVIYLTLFILGSFVSMTPKKSKDISDDPQRRVAPSQPDFGKE